jgi:hypothetical protein
VWRPPHQAAFATCALLAIVATTYTSLSNTPHYAKKMGALFHAPAATAASATGTSATDTSATAAPTSDALSGSRAATAPVTHASKLHTLGAGEGEGVVTPYLTRDMPPAGATTLGGYLPEEEKSLFAALRAIRLPHRLVSVDVAQIRVGTWSYRSAAVRFEVRRSGAGERQRVAETAGRIVRRAFHSNPRLQNVDVAAVALNDPQQTQSQRYVFAPGAVPIFTASVARRNLHVKGVRWVNVPSVDGGSWLRARSRLYINAQLLPPITAGSSAPAAPTPVVPTPAAGAQTKPTPPAIKVRPSLAVPPPVRPALTTPTPADPTVGVRKEPESTTQQRPVPASPRT